MEVDDARASPAASAWWPSWVSVMLALALFVPRIAEGVYWGLDLDAPPAFGLFATLWFYMSLTAWFWSYCRTHRLPWLMDMGWFLILAWFVVVPYVVIHRERGWGVLRVGLFIVANAAAVGAEWATATLIDAMVGAG